MRIALIVCPLALAAMLAHVGCQPARQPPEPTLPASSADLEQWAAELHSDDAATRSRAAEALRGEGERGARQLVSCFEHEDALVRARCSELVVSMGAPVLPVLVEVIEVIPTAGSSSRDWRRRETAFASIRRMGPDAASVSPALLALLRVDAHEQTQRWVSGAWVAIGAAALPEVERAFFDEDPNISQVGLDAAWRLGPPALDFLFETVAHGTSKENRTAAAFAIGRMHSSARDEGGLVLHDDQGYLKDYISVEAGSIRQRAIQMLCPLRSRRRALESVDAVLSHWGSPMHVCDAPRQQTAVAQWLESAAARDAPDRLIDIVQFDPDPALRARAVTLLGRWASTAPEDASTAAAQHTTVAVLGEPHPLGPAAAQIVRVYADGLAAGSLRAVVDALVTVAARGPNRRLPGWLFQQIGGPAFDEVLRVLDDETRPVAERVVAMQTIAGADLDALVAATSPPTTRASFDMRRKSAVTRAERADLSELRAAAVDAIWLVDRHPPSTRMAPRIARHLNDPEPAVRIAAVMLTSRLVLRPRQRRVRASIPELDRWESPPLRPFARERCREHRTVPRVDASDAALRRWAICRLIAMTDDGDEEVADRARQQLRFAGIVPPP